MELNNHGTKVSRTHGSPKTSISRRRNNWSPEKQTDNKDCAESQVKHAMMTCIIYHVLQQRQPGKKLRNDIIVIDQEDQSLDTIHFMFLSTTNSIIIHPSTTPGFNQHIVRMFSLPTARQRLNGRHLQMNKYDSTSTLANDSSVLSSYDHQIISRLFQSSLNQYNLFGDADIDFTVNVGKTVFLSPMGCNDKKISRSAWAASSQNIFKHQFSSEIKPQYLNFLHKKLLAYKFDCSQSGDIIENVIKLSLSKKTGSNSVEFHANRDDITNYFNKDQGSAGESNGGSDDDSDVKQSPFFKVTCVDTLPMLNINTTSLRMVDVIGQLYITQQHERGISRESKNRLIESCKNLDFAQEDMTGMNVTSVKQLMESTTWSKDIWYADNGSATLKVQAKLMKKHHLSPNYEGYDREAEFLDVQLYFDIKRTKVSGDGLAAEFCLLKKWAELIFS